MIYYYTLIQPFLYHPPIFAVSIETSLALGLEKSQSGDYRGAVIEFNKVIAIDPDNASAYQYRGVAKAKCGDFDFPYEITTK